MQTPARKRGCCFVKRQHKCGWIQLYAAPPSRSTVEYVIIACGVWLHDLHPAATDFRLLSNSCSARNGDFFLNSSLFTKATHPTVLYEMFIGTATEYKTLIHLNDWVS